MPSTSALVWVAEGSSAWRRGKGEQAVGQRRGALGGTLGATGIALEIGEAALFESQTEHVQTADHTGQQVVKVMSDASGQLAHGFHLLALAQLFLGLAQGFLLLTDGGDFAHRRIDEAILQHRIPRQPAIAAFSMPIAILEAEHRFAVLQAFQGRLGAGAILDMHEGHERLVAQLFFAPAQGAGPGWIKVQQLALQGRRTEQIGAGLPDQITLAGAQGDLFAEIAGEAIERLQAAALGRADHRHDDVDQHEQRMGHPAFREQCEIGGCLDEEGLGQQHRQQGGEDAGTQAEPEGRGHDEGNEQQIGQAVDAQAQADSGRDGDQQGSAQKAQGSRRLPRDQLEQPAEQGMGGNGHWR
ncbi:hypothetical protein QE444_001844 [Pseudomonas sp. SORGH_AS199]|nr:hypothetical protein [Pseudomonas sp. SORGH_AS_0199]